MTITDDMVKQFADAKAGSGGDAASEEPANTDDSGAEDGSGGDGGEQATGGDQSVDESPAPTVADVVESVDAAGDESGGVDTGVPEDPVAAAAHWRGVAEREEKRRKDMQSHTDRQVAEAQAKIEALEQLWDTEDAEYNEQQARAAQNQQFAASLSDTEQLDQWVSVAPQDAFQSVLTNAPDKIHELIASVHRVHGPEFGQQAQRAYDNALVTQQLQAQQQAMQQMQERIEGPARQRAEFTAAIEGVKAKYPAEQLQALAPHVKELITANYGDRAKYASTEAFVEAQYLRAHYNQSMQAASQQAAAPMQPVAAPHVERGGSAAVSAPEKSYEQTKAEQLAAAFQNGRTYG